MPECTVIIRAYNEEEHIGRLLSGLLQQTVRDVEIIVVDSGSTDATLSIVSRFPVKIIRINPEQFTFGRSLNYGCAAAASPFLVFASAHVYPVYPDWLGEMIKGFDDPAVALVYGKQRGNRRTRFSEQQQFAKMFPENSVPEQRHPFCNNANAAVRRSLWEEHNYDEELSGLEDLAWATWAVEKGYYLYYSAEAEIIHLHDESPRKVYNRYLREAMALKTINPYESFHFFDLIRLYATNVFSDFRNAIAEGAFGDSLWEILWFRWMQFWGTYRGFAISGPLTAKLKETFYYPRGLERPKLETRRDVEPIDYGGWEKD
jgi:glycosyltransferase involved in cell wall biosynthesis